LIVPPLPAALPSKITTTFGVASGRDDLNKNVVKMKIVKEKFD
jgi:hypothetical protein